MPNHHPPSDHYPRALSERDNHVTKQSRRAERENAEPLAFPAKCDKLSFQACDTNVPRFSGSLPDSDSEGDNQKFKVLSSLRRKLVKFKTVLIFNTVTPCG